MKRPLPYKKVDTSPVLKRVLAFDPYELYERVGDKIDPYKRWTSVSMQTLFPSKEDGTCGCGCGEKLTDRRTRWASDECRSFVGYVWAVIAGDIRVIRMLLYLYYGDYCQECNDGEHGLQVDHIVPVVHGGGGGWLSNYRILCRGCHRDKTNKDFGWKKWYPKKVTPRGTAAPKAKKPRGKKKAVIEGCVCKDGIVIDKVTDLPRLCVICNSK